jgi:hypothetical protein
MGVVRGLDSKQFGALAAIILIVGGTIGATLGFVSMPHESTDEEPQHEDQPPLIYSMPQLITVSENITHDFADFNPYPEDYVVSSTDYEILPDLSNVNIHPDFDLTPEEIELIEQNGFVVVPQSGFGQIYEILDANFWSSIPGFVTSDAVLHAFHVLYDMTLRVAESWTFWDLIGNLTDSLLNTTYYQYLNAPEGRWKESALRNLAYFSVAMSLLDNESVVHEEVRADVAQVLELIENHSAVSNEWFMNQKEDFSQYVPRGHYTRTDLLKSYFRAMMWYGRITFRLIPNGVLSPNDVGKDETAQAVLISLALGEIVNSLPYNVSGYDVWDALYEPTAFFVGFADDLVPSDYRATIDNVYGDSPNLQSLDDESKLDQLISQLVENDPPRILSGWLFDNEGMNQTMGLRFMGQRFVPDSYILGQLVYAYVGSSSKPRLMPKGLDVMAALGSERAWSHLDDQKHFDDYIQQMEKMWAFINAVSNDEWTQNLYWLWLYSLLPLLVDPSEGFPLFMKSDAWVDKQLMTALASWTELRHDTILYVKQSYGHVTSYPDKPLGYVEPVPRVYARLAALCKTMVSGLDGRSLLPSEISERLNMLHDFLMHLERISRKELSGEALNSTDLGLIHGCGSLLEYISKMPYAYSGLMSAADDRMPVIADVHTDLTFGEVLEEAVGFPMIIYVAVRVNNKTVLTRGGTFSYYEFKQPMANRLTDEAWQQMLDNGEEPLMPSWTGSFTPTSSAPSIEIVAPNQSFSYAFKRRPAAGSALSTY